MSSLSKLSARVVLAASLCSAPLALGQPTVNAVMANSHPSIMSSTPVPALSIFALKSHDKHECEGDDERDKHCQPVPEGGAAAMYLLLAGLSCFGALVLRSRRQARASQSS
jgi:hypothetical protein